jgi:hypothetical protein
LVNPPQTPTAHQAFCLSEVISRSTTHLQTYGVPVVGAQIFEDVQTEGNQFASDPVDGSYGVESQVNQFPPGSPVMAGGTNSDGSFTDQPLEANNQTPLQSAKVTKTLLYRRKWTKGRFGGELDTVES